MQSAVLYAMQRVMSLSILQVDVNKWRPLIFKDSSEVHCITGLDFNSVSLKRDQLRSPVIGQG